MEKEEILSKYTNQDAPADTEASNRDVTRAHHDARDHAAAEGSLPERNAAKCSDSEDGSALHSLFVFLGLVK